jgi:hypothetical protein
LSLRLATCLVALVLTPRPSASQSAAIGSIHGLVLRQDGQPLSDATILGLPEEDMRRQIRTTTDNQGKFLLENVPAGLVYVHAFKESDWYPYNFFSFFSGPETPLRVRVEAGRTSEKAVIHLGPPAGALNIEVFDQNGAPLPEGVNLVFRRDDIPGDYRRGANASTRLLLVPAVPFHLTVEAQGYQPWHSGVLTPEPQKALDIALRMTPLRPAGGK